ncbi:ribosomal 40S subunit protein S1B [Rhodotorula kratochvilovae]
MLVPDQSHSLFLLKRPELKAHIVVDDKPLPVFGMTESPKKVTGFVQGAYGAEFAVCLYDGRTKQAKRGNEAALFFGEQIVARNWVKSGEIEYKSSADDDERFVLWDEVSVDAEHTRRFAFGTVPTSDDRSTTSQDHKWLDGVAAIKIEYLKSKVVRMPKQKKKKDAKLPQPSEDAAYDPLKAQKADKRSVFEGEEKGNFGLTASFGALQKKDKLPASAGEEKEKRYTTTYDYVDKDKPDITFVFYIRSDVWIRNFLAGEGPQEPERPKTPPLTVGDAIYLDTTLSEAEEEQKRVCEREPKRRRLEDKGKGRATPSSSDADDENEMGSLASHACDDPNDNPDGASMGGGDDSGYYGNDYDSDDDLYASVTSTSATSGPAPNTRASVDTPPVFPASTGADELSTAAVASASSDLIATLKAQLAAAQASNARLRRTMQMTSKKRSASAASARPPSPSSSRSTAPSAAGKAGSSNAQGRRPSRTAGRIAAVPGALADMPTPLVKVEPQLREENFSAPQPVTGSEALDKVAVGAVGSTSKASAVERSPLAAERSASSSSIAGWQKPLKSEERSQSPALATGASKRSAAFKPPRLASPAIPASSTPSLDSPRPLFPAFPLALDSLAPLSGIRHGETQVHPSAASPFVLSDAARHLMYGPTPTRQGRPRRRRAAAAPSSKTRRKRLARHRARGMRRRTQVKLLKQPKFDVSKLMELHSASTEAEIGKSVQRDEFIEPAVLESV